jgi:hypothetical protein
MNMKPMNFPPGKVHAIGKRKPRLMMNSSSWKINTLLFLSWVIAMCVAPSPGWYGWLFICTFPVRVFAYKSDILQYHSKLYNSVVERALSNITKTRRQGNNKLFIYVLIFIFNSFQRKS